MEKLVMSSNLLGSLKKTTNESMCIASSLKERLHELQSEISADDAGIVDLEGRLRSLEKDRLNLKDELSRAEAFFSSLADEARLGGLMKEFEKMQNFLTAEYGNAREGHAKAIGLLKTEFSYNPAFKKAGKHSDKQFSGTYFTPKRDPNGLICFCCVTVLQCPRKTKHCLTRKFP